ncbi:MAG: hypothetical protein AABY27_07050, partial [Pseudomonadota bacterium]
MKKSTDLEEEKYQRLIALAAVVASDDTAEETLFEEIKKLLVIDQLDPRHEVNGISAFSAASDANNLKILTLIEALDSAKQVTNTNEQEVDNLEKLDSYYDLGDIKTEELKKLIDLFVQTKVMKDENRKSLLKEIMSLVIELQEDG